ncbi:transmembrane protein 273 isoform X3 [Vulpes vulpes]|uniref:Transmembrane protein 273 isoform X3 n=1 Tax=Vulpes vulpes TaxID=9627 RepID=A0ABM4YYL9_VULVU
MGSGTSMLRAFLLLLDIKYAVIGAALGGAIAAVFLALKVCMIKKHLFDIDSSNLRSTTPGFNDTVTLKKRVPRSKLHFSERDAEVIEL